jgi:ABC-type nitrate/sulfonate/bicarbonate transport system permease component
MKIKKGDNIIVIAGANKGKKGKVLKAMPTLNKVIVEGVNMHKKSRKAMKKGEQGQVLDVALPVFDVLQSFPTFAALPLAIYFWGPSNFTTIFFLIFTIIWPIFFAILSSLKLMKHEWDEVAEIYGLTGKEYLKKFLIPVSVPGLITGSIVGLGEAWEAVVATEIIVGMQSGLGPFFQSFAANSGVTVFGILGFLILIFSINKIIWIPLLDWSHSFIEE